MASKHCQSSVGYTPNTSFARDATPVPPTLSFSPTAIPFIVYRIHRVNAQTRYSFATGFSAKNHTTIINNASALSRFGLAHLCQRTNISSPFISVYDNLQHAEIVAEHWAEKWGEEVLVVSVNTRHFAWGPVFRAAHLLESRLVKDEELLHKGEYLVMHRIPAQAIRDQTPVACSKKEDWRTVGYFSGA